MTGSKAPMALNLRGSLFMVLSMAGFAVEDMFIKAAARTLPLGEVLFLYGGAGLGVFVVLTAREGDRLWHPAYLSRGILIRSGFEVTGRLFYALAFVFAPLVTATAILQATPLLVVAGAAVVFGEKVSLARRLGILAGFAGVMLILRPGPEGLNVMVLLAVVGMVGFAGRDLATRAAPPVLSHLQLGIVGFTMLTLVGFVLALVQGGFTGPGWAEAGLMAGATGFGVVGYYALTVAMRTGDVGVVTPWRYTRLLFAMAIGAVVFGERPDLLMLVGSAVVVGSGVFTLLAGRR
ncbi:MAG: DMT family transporter [Rhodobacterales bacterium]|nr:DMT family transporter [Rhodobacterales bacterium]